MTTHTQGGSRGRSRARRRIVQALYQWQLAGQSLGEIRTQFRDSDEHRGADDEYFSQILEIVIAQHEALDADLATLTDRPPPQLDPVEHAILLAGMCELQHRIDVPYRVVISEAIGLAKRFGAQDGHQFVNAVLDKAALKWRSLERNSGQKSRP